MRDTITLGGVTYGTTTADIITGSVTLGESLTASELSVDTLTAEVTAWTAPAASYGDPVVYYRDSTLMGKFFVQTIDRIGRKRWKINAVSAVGLLDSVKHYGGIYDGQTSASEAANIIADVIGDTFAYSLDGFEDLPLYGWLPIASRRDNLKQVLFALGANITKDASGDVVISALPDEIATTIPKSRTFRGGKVSYPVGASAVKITEHGFAKSNDEKEIYSGDIASETVVSPSGVTYTGQIVEFGEPYWDISTYDTTILESGANYAVLAPAPGVTLRGKQYAHSQKVVTIYRADGAGAADYVPEVKDCTLVSLANSQNVAQRVLAYYGGCKRVEQDIIVDEERPGDRVIFYDPYGEKNGGYIRKLNLKMGELLRGGAVFETGYVPSGIGNNYKYVQVEDESGTVTLPDTNRVRFVLIGGGTGGSGGYPGKEGHQPNTGQYSEGRDIAEIVDDGDPETLQWSGIKTYQAKYWCDSISAKISSNNRAYIDGHDMTEYIYRKYGDTNASTREVSVWEAFSAGYRYLKQNTSSCQYVINARQDNYYTYAYVQAKTAVIRSVTSNYYWAEYEETTPGGDGGAGGSGGQGGKVYFVDAEISPGDTVTLVVGTGGEGGAAASGDDPPTDGEDGTATTLTINGTTYTSADGQIYSQGYVDVLSGVRYGATGDTGVHGAAGGATEGATFAYAGESLGNYDGGAPGAGYGSAGAMSGGGSGGGAASAADGGDGGDSTNSRTGSGGDGADATQPAAATVYGQGGAGGNGGGGGGNAGGYDERSSQKPLGYAGAGGDGSAGGDGAPGVLLIFYGDAVPIEAEDALRDSGRLAMVDEDGDPVVVGSGYRSAYSGWQIDDFIEEVNGNG